jgi:hypothetical protein
MLPKSATTPSGQSLRSCLHSVASSRFGAARSSFSRPPLPLPARTASPGLARFWDLPEGYGHRYTDIFAETL